MRTEIFDAFMIDDAALQIIYMLKKMANTTRTVSSRENVFYFDGWDGLGASAVLRVIAQLLTPTSPDGNKDLDELGFDQVIHIDCSMWENRRELQREVAKQLELPDEAMAMFDRQHEEDDFGGVDQASRVEVQQVLKEMQQQIQKLNRKFLVIFHNGSGEEINLASCCGFSLSGFSTSKVLWTFQGRFRLKPRTKVDKAMASAGMTDVFISATSTQWERDPAEIWSHLVHEEAMEVAASTCKINTKPGSTIDLPAQVSECFLYMLELCRRAHHSIDYDFSTHGANYWVCDGIIHQLQQGDKDVGLDGDESWRAAEALQREMQLDMDYHSFLPSTPLARFVQSKPYWTSPTCGLTRILDGAIPDGGIFQHHLDKLRVLKISHCTFNLKSPPFLCCHSLRFLWLDHCQDVGTSTDEARKEEDIRCFFQRLWVLDVRYTSCDQILSVHMLDLMPNLRELNVMGAHGWDMGQLQGRLPNINKLRVTKSQNVHCSGSENNLFSYMNKLELFDFSGSSSDFVMKSLSGPGVICLETVIIIDGFGGLLQISLKGCTKLKNLVLGGKMWSLHTLDISGTSVKTLDLTATTFDYLDELYLLDCTKLCAIKWPPKDKMKQDLSKMCIDTTQQSTEENIKRGTTTPRTGATVEAVLHGSRLTSEFPWYICVRDARLLGSLEAVYTDYRKIYVEVSSTTRPSVASDYCKDEGIKSSRSNEQHVLVSLQRRTASAIYAADSTLDQLQHATECDDDAQGIMWMWPCPDVPDLPQESCYMRIQDMRGSEETSPITVPEFVLSCAKILHVHDSLSITTIPFTEVLGSEWKNLEWCRIERCPRVDAIFTPPAYDDILDHKFIKYKLRTFWASQLPKARYIWSESGLSRVHRIFQDLTFLHLDCCPRLILVLPLSYTMISRSTMPSPLDGTFHQLKALEITWCGDIHEVFPLDTMAKHHRPQPVIMDFPSLKRIHLHELPSLEHICGVRMSAPNLETVKIRGCWSLRHLPDVSSSTKVVECDCEKEWWDKLEWDGGSQASHYKLIHSQYYKKTLLRGSVLR